MSSASDSMLKNTPQRDETDRIYLGYCNRIFDCLHYKKYSLWAEMLVGDGRPKIPTELLEDLDGLVEYLDSRASYDGYEIFNQLFTALSLLIHDFSNVFDLYCDGKTALCTIRAFYKEDPKNLRYDEDLQDFTAYTDFIRNLIYELTRVCNALLAEARKLMIDYYPDFGIFSIDGISHKGSVIVRFEYREGEMYKGLESFIGEAMTREFYRPFDKERIARVLGDMLNGSFISGH